MSKYSEFLPKPGRVWGNADYLLAKDRDHTLTGEVAKLLEDFDNDTMFASLQLEVTVNDQIYCVRIPHPRTSPHLPGHTLNAGDQIQCTIRNGGREPGRVFDTWLFIDMKLLKAASARTAAKGERDHKRVLPPGVDRAPLADPNASRSNVEPPSMEQRRYLEKVQANYPDWDGELPDLTPKAPDFREWLANKGGNYSKLLDQETPSQSRIRPTVPPHRQPRPEPAEHTRGFGGNVASPPALQSRTSTPSQSEPRYAPVVPTVRHRESTPPPPHLRPGPPRNQPPPRRLSAEGQPQQRHSRPSSGSAASGQSSSSSSRGVLDRTIGKDRHHRGHHHKHHQK